MLFPEGGADEYEERGRDEMSEHDRDVATGREMALKEFDKLRGLRHINIVEVYEGYVTPDFLTIAMESIDGGELLRYITYREKYDEEFISKVMRQILDALQYLHNQHGIVHLNLQPDNIIMVSRRQQLVKIVDFGNAIHVKDMVDGDRIGKLDLPIEYQPPEVLNFEPVNTFADIWSVGLLAHILLSGQSTFRGEDYAETHHNVSMVRYSLYHFYRNVSKESVQFIQQTLKRGPKNRLTVDECLEHRWLSLTERMTRKRESCSFYTNRIRSFYLEHSLARRDKQTTSAHLLQAYGSLSRASSLESDLSI